MPRRKRKKTFSAAKAVKAAAREHVGAPPPTRRVPDITKETKPKHKPTLERLLSED